MATWSYHFVFEVSYCTWYAFSLAFSEMRKLRFWTWGVITCPESGKKREDASHLPGLGRPTWTWKSYFLNVLNLKKVLQIFYCCCFEILFNLMQYCSLIVVTIQIFRVISSSSLKVPWGFLSLQVTNLGLRKLSPVLKWVLWKNYWYSWYFGRI